MGPGGRYDSSLLAFLVAANLWTRSIYEAYLRRAATPAQEAQQAKPASPVVEFGAVLLIVAVDHHADEGSPEL